MVIFEIVAVLSGVMFTGAAIYINMVEHPARMECGTELAATVFGPSYDRASKMQASLALLSAMSSLCAYWTGGTVLWLVGALFIFFVVPFTLVALMKTNNQLKSPSLNKSADSTRRLLLAWGRLHAVRSVSSFIASGIFLYSITSG